MRFVNNECNRNLGIQQKVGILPCRGTFVLLVLRLIDLPLNFSKQIFESASLLSYLGNFLNKSYVLQYFDLTGFDGTIWRRSLLVIVQSSSTKEESP